MGLVYDQFAHELKSVQRKYADRPRDELIALCLMALEGKELVTVGYREDLINRRLESMPLSEHFLGDQFASAIWVEQGTAGSAAPRGFFPSDSNISATQL